MIKQGKNRTFHKPSGQRKKGTGSRRTPALWRSIVLAFAGGVVSCGMLLAIFAWLLSHTSLPLTLVRPAACMAAAIGAAVSGWILAQQIRRQFLLCGVACGVFYAVCPFLASLILSGGYHWQQADLMLPLALVLGGTTGGTMAALRFEH